MLEAEDCDGGGDGESEGGDEEGEVHRPAAPELAQIALVRLLVGHLHVHLGRRLERAQPVRRQSQRQLVAPPLVPAMQCNSASSSPSSMQTARNQIKERNGPEAVEAAEVVRDGGVEGEVGEREQARGRPEVAALEAARRRGGDG